MIGAAGIGFAENQNGGRNAGVRFEDAAGLCLLKPAEAPPSYT